MWTFGRSKRAKLVSEEHNEVAKVQCVPSKEKENSANLEKCLGERIFNKVSQLQRQLEGCRKEKGEHLDKIAELEEKLLEQKAICLNTIAEAEEKLRTTRHVSAEHLMSTWKLDARLLFLEQENVGYLKKISELEEQLQASVENAAQVCADTSIEEQRLSPAAGQRSAGRATPSGTSSDTSDISRRAARPRLLKGRMRIPPTFSYRHDSDDSKSSGDDSKSSGDNSNL